MSNIEKRENLFDKISGLIEQARRKVATTINQEMVLLYWNIGKTIKEQIIKLDRAEYGKQILHPNIKPPPPPPFTAPSLL